MRYTFESNWSFSKLMMYESCPMRVRLKYIDKCPEPPQPPDSPLERGSRIHDNLENFVKGEGTLDGNEAKKLAPFVDPLHHLQDLYAAGKATAEENLYFNVDWDMCERDDVWLWLKKDFNVVDQDRALTITGDYKSGKSTYKTAEHIQQLQLYAACDALEFPWAEVHYTELWYVDEGWVRKASYTHDQALSFVGRFQRRVDRMYNDRLFRPNPNKVTCRWCPFSPRGTGACPVGV